jgi:hypothetical protein
LLAAALLTATLLTAALLTATLLTAALLTAVLLTAALLTAALLAAALLTVSTAATIVAAATAARILTGIEHLHFPGNDFGRISFLSVLTFPRPGLKTTFDINLAPLLQILVADLGEPTPGDDAVPLGLLLPLVRVLVHPGFVRGYTEIRNPGTVRRILELGICSYITDQNYLVNTSSCHTWPPCF